MNLDIIRLDEDTGNINYDVHWGFDVWDLVTMVIPSDESRDEAKTREQNICNHLLNVLNVDVLVQLIMVYWNRVNVADSLHKKFQLHGILNWKGPEDRFPGRYRVLNMNNPNSMKPLVEIKKFHETIFRDLQFDHLRWFIIDCPGIQELHSFCGRTLTRTEIQLIVGSNQMMSWDINSGNRCGPRNELSVIRLDQDTGNIYYDVLWGFDVWDVVTIVTSSLRGQARARDRKVHKHLLNCFNHVDVLAQLVFTYWARANVIDLLRKKFQLHGVFNWQGPKKSLPNKERVMNNRHYKEPLVEVKKFHDVSFQRDLSLDSQRWFILDCPSIPELAYLCSPSLTRVEIQHIVACNQLVGIYKGKPFFIF